MRNEMTRVLLTSTGMRHGVQLCWNAYKKSQFLTIITVFFVNLNSDFASPRSRSTTSVEPLECHSVDDVVRAQRITCMISINQLRWLASFSGHHCQHIFRASPRHTYPSPAMPIVVDDPPTLSKLLLFKPNLQSGGAQPDPMLQNNRIPQQRLYRNASCQDRLRRTHIRLAVPGAQLCCTSEYNLIAVRVDGDQLRRVTRVDLQELGQAGVCRDHMLPADREERVVAGERSCAQARAVDDDGRHWADGFQGLDRHYLDLDDVYLSVRRMLRFFSAKRTGATTP